MTVSFQTNKLKSRRKANIDGHEYTVRQYGNIERLEVLRLQDEINGIISKYPPNTPESEMKKEDIDSIQSKAYEASQTLISLFDDGTETQEKAKKLVASLDEDDIVEIITTIFEQTEPNKQKVTDDGES